MVPQPDPDDATTPQILTGETPNPIHIPPGCRFHPRCPIVAEHLSRTDPQLRPAPGTPPGHDAACLLL